MMRPAALVVALLAACSLGHAARMPREGPQPIEISVKPSTTAPVRSTPEAEADLVTELPDAPPLKSKLYSGYVTVDEAAGRALFYAFVESEGSPLTDPVVMWLNGGPGCSSIGGGFMSELGPYYPTEDGSLEINPTRWNKVANMLFLESPAFVGFSYSNTSSDKVVGDQRTAADARAFLLGFFEKFPHLAKNQFYVSGESYGGHYVPNLAHAIVAGNAAGTGHINLAGFLVGNAWTDPPIDNRGAAVHWYTHALISHATYSDLVLACNLSAVGPLLAGAENGEGGEGRRLGAPDPAKCDSAQDAAMEEMGNINIYEIYADICAADVAPAASRRRAGGGAAAALRGPARLAAALSAKGGLGRGSGSLGARAAASVLPAYDPCIDDAVTVYLNRPEVQAALHANTTGAVPGPWSDCSDVVDYSRADLLTSMFPTWRALLAHGGGLRMLVYSGDVDGIVPVTGTRAWIDRLRLPIKSAWRPWYPTGSPQVGGYTVSYAPKLPGQNGLELATVRNAGHMVPYTQPERAFYMFSHFLHGKAL